MWQWWCATSAIAMKRLTNALKAMVVVQIIVAWLKSLGLGGLGSSDKGGYKGVGR